MEPNVEMIDFQTTNTQETFEEQARDMVMVQGDVEGKYEMVYTVDVEGKKDI